MTINCGYLGPVRWSEATKQLIPLDNNTLRNDTWNWSQKTCTSTDPTGTPILVQNPDTGASFYLSPTISYMDFYWFIFTSAILIFWITKTIANFLKSFFSHHV